jgi:hypothetical protein
MLLFCDGGRFLDSNSHDYPIIKDFLMLHGLWMERGWLAGSQKIRGE